MGIYGCLQKINNHHVIARHEATSARQVATKAIYLMGIYGCLQKINNHHVIARYEATSAR